MWNWGSFSIAIPKIQLWSFPESTRSKKQLIKDFIDRLLFREITAKLLVFPCEVCKYDIAGVIVYGIHDFD